MQRSACSTDYLIIGNRMKECEHSNDPKTPALLPNVTRRRYSLQCRAVPVPSCNAFKETPTPSRANPGDPERRPNAQSIPVPSCRASNKIPGALPATHKSLRSDSDAKFFHFHLATLSGNIQEHSRPAQKNQKTVLEALRPCPLRFPVVGIPLA